MASADNVLQWFRLLNGNTSNASDIFFACLGAITASTFLALHLNVPRSRATSKTRRLYLLGRSALWGLMVVVAPELLLSIAFGDWRASHIGTKVLREFGTGNVINWTNRHTRFANMGGVVFEMQKDGSDIPGLAPYRENMGPVRLNQVYDEMNRPTITQLNDILERLMLKLQILSVIRWVQFLLSLLTSLARSIMRVTYKQWWPRINSSLHRAPTDGTVELEDFQNSSSRPEARIFPAMSNGIVQIQQEPGNIHFAELSVSVQGREERANSRETDEEPFPSRPPSLDLGHVGHNIFNYLDASFEPVMTSAVVASDEIRSSYDGNVGVAEDGIVDITSMGVDEQNTSNTDDTTQLLPHDTIQLHLNSIQIAAAQILGILGDFPEITLEDIEARSNTNAPAKALSVLQLLWFGLKIIIQLARGYTISQLELASITYVLCALFSYVLFWSKPQGVESPTKHIINVSDTVRPVTDEDLRNLRRFGGSPFLIRNFVPPFGMGYRGHEPTMPIPTDISLTAFSSFGPAGQRVFFGDSDFLGLFVGMIFGGLYCLGWNDPFSSAWEQWSWRLCALIITVSLIPYSIANEICTVRFQPLFYKHNMAKTHIVHVIVLFFLLGIYIFCRCFMLIEMVRTLFS